MQHFCYCFCASSAVSPARKGVHCLPDWVTVSRQVGGGVSVGRSLDVMLPKDLPCRRRRRRLPLLFLPSERWFIVLIVVVETGLPLFSNLTLLWFTVITQPFSIPYVYLLPNDCAHSSLNIRKQHDFYLYLRFMHVLLDKCLCFRTCVNLTSLAPWASPAPPAGFQSKRCN